MATAMARTVCVCARARVLRAAPPEHELDTGAGRTKMLPALPISCTTISMAARGCSSVTIIPWRTCCKRLAQAHCTVLGMPVYQKATRAVPTGSVYNR